MKEMREVVRSDDMDAGLANLLPRLEKAVLDSEQRRETRVNQTSAALTALVSQLQTLPLPREVSRPLKNFAKQLDGRVGQAREIPLLLSELSGLQGKALSQLENPAEPDRPGLLQRLFGSREADETVAAPMVQLPASQPVQAACALRAETPQPAVDLVPVIDEPQVVPTVAPAAVAPEPLAIEASPAATLAPVVVAFVPPVLEPQNASPRTEEAPAPTPPVVEQAPQAQPASNPDELISLPPPSPLAVVDPEQPEHDILYALPDSPEPSYSSVAKHIEDTLLGLLDDLTLPERHRPQAEAMRDRLQNGLNWYELLPILDDLATLMLAITDSGQHEFETYLQQLNERLESFQSNLLAASTGHADNHSAAREMDTQIREARTGKPS
jgi:diguanylate cyclase